MLILFLLLTCTLHGLENNKNNYLNDNELVQIIWPGYAVHINFIKFEQVINDIHIEQNSLKFLVDSPYPSILTIGYKKLFPRDNLDYELYSFNKKPITVNNSSSPSFTLSKLYEAFIDSTIKELIIVDNKQNILQSYSNVKDLYFDHNNQRLFFIVNNNSETSKLMILNNLDTQIAEDYLSLPLIKHIKHFAQAQKKEIIAVADSDKLIIINIAQKLLYIPNYPCEFYKTIRSLAFQTPENLVIGTDTYLKIFNVKFNTQVNEISYRLNSNTVCKKIAINNLDQTILCLYDQNTEHSSDVSSCCMILYFLPQLQLSHAKLNNRFSDINIKTQSF